MSSILERCTFLWRLLALLLTLFSSSGSGAPPLHLVITPQVATRFSPIRFSIYCLPHAQDQVMAVSATSGSYLRESRWEPQGRRQHIIEWRALPSGRYNVIAAVGTRSQWRTQVRQRLIVN
jgi:hypothetical protein